MRDESQSPGTEKAQHAHRQFIGDEFPQRLRQITRFLQWQGDQAVTAEAPIGHGQIARLERVQPLAQQGQFRVGLVALNVIEEHAAGEAEKAHAFESRKTAARFLRTGLGISALIFGRVGQTEGGAVDDFGFEAIPELLAQRQNLVGVGGDGLAQALADVQGRRPRPWQLPLVPSSTGSQREDKSRLGFAGRLRGRGSRD